MLFSDLSVSEETHDASGTEFAIEHDSALRWHGTVRVAEGELGTPHPLVALTIDSIGGAISLAYSEGASNPVVRFSGRVTCDSIFGEWRPYPGIVKRKTYRRVAHSGAIPTAADQ